MASTSSSSNVDTLKIYEEREPSHTVSETSITRYQQSKKRRIFRESVPRDVQTLGQVDYEAQKKQITAANQTGKLDKFVPQPKRLNTLTRNEL
jgi:hypothetical protein